MSNFGISRLRHGNVAKIFFFFRLCSPENIRTVSDQLAEDGVVAPQPLTDAQSPSEPLVLYVPEVEEIRISPVVARKGYLNVLEHKSNGWKKRWVVSIFFIHLNFTSLLSKPNFNFIKLFIFFRLFVDLTFSFSEMKKIRSKEL